MSLRWHRREFNDEIDYARGEQADDLMAVADAVQDPPVLAWDTSRMPTGFGALTQWDVCWLHENWFAV